jgi:hypothetical protein
LLDGQKQPHKNAFDKNSEGEITTSGHQNLRNVAEKIETLQEVVALLDVQHQPRHNSLNADKEHESSVNNE